MKYLVRLAAVNPERFKDEWNVRIDSWVVEIKKRAGIIGNEEQPAFELVDEARHILAECGIKENILDKYCSVDALVNEYSRTLYSHIGDRGHRLTVTYKRRD